MKISSRIISIVILLALVTSVAAAEIEVTLFSHEAEFDSPEHLTKVCGCGVTTDTYLLENVGDFPASFSLTLEADEEWISIPDERVMLEAGEQRTLEVLLAPGCDERGEDAEYRVFASSEFGRYRAADRQVDVLACQPIGLSLEPDVQTTAPCSPAELNIQLTNTASYEESYKITIKPQGLDERIVHTTIPPGETVDETFQVQWPCSVHGERQVVVDVDALKTGVSQSAVSDIIIPWDFGFRASITDAQVCAEVPTTTQLVLSNEGASENVFDLRIQEPWASLERSNVSLDVGETVRIPITLQPTEQEAGQQTITVIAAGRFGESTQAATARVEVEDCYEHEVTVKPQSVTACAGPQNFSVRVANLGRDTERFTLRAAGDIFSELTKDSLILKSGEHATVTLQALVPDRNEEYTINVQTEQTPGVSSETPVRVDAISNAACTQVQPQETEFTVYTSDRVVPILIEHEGVRADTFKVEHDGRVLQPQEEEVFLSAGEQAILHFEVMETDSTGTFIETLTLTSSRASYRYDLAIDLKDKSVFTRAYEAFVFSEERWCLWGVLLLTILSLVMIAALALLRIGALQNPRMRNDTRYALTVILVGLALIAVVLGAWQASSIDPAPTEQGVGSDPADLYFEVAQRGELTIDLDRFFEDPEGERLEYMSTQPQNLRVRIDGSDASIRPDRGFSGVERVAFTAVDPQGAAADSPIMTVRVLSQQPRTLGGWLTTYCTTLIWWLLALILLLGAASMYISKDKKLEKRYGKRVRAVIVPEKKPVVSQSERIQPPMKPSEKVSVQGDVVGGDKIVQMGATPTLVTSGTGTKVHKISCPVAQRIPKNKREIYGTKEEAIKAGYNACRICSPFE